MDRLNYAVLKRSAYDGYILDSAPERVMQFGEGNFLRAFADYWFDCANEKAGWNGKCALIQPIPTGLTDTVNAQQGLYTLYLRGMGNGQRVNRKRIISSVSRCINPYTGSGFDALMELAASDDLQYIVSNTTEAGIAFDPACRPEDTPAASFPGKLTQVLYHRYNSGKPGLIILSCELIDNNGKELQKCVNAYMDAWLLEDGFRRYVNEECLFCSTLVDRIVSGRIKDENELSRLEAENGYTDALTDVGEVFGLWVIEGPDWLEDRLPFKKAGLNCMVVPDITPYKKRKVRILNGAHTGFTLGAYLAGFDIVRDCMKNDIVRGFMNRMLYEEVIPVLPLDREDLIRFAAAVQDRFANPFVDHELMSISLNSTSKWRARNLPSLLEYTEKTGSLPTCITLSFAAYMAFFSNNIQALTAEGLLCRREKGNDYLCVDDRRVLEFYWAHRNDTPEQLVHAVMRRTDMWGMDLTSIPGFEAAATDKLAYIHSHGTLAAFAACLQ